MKFTVNYKSSKKEWRPSKSYDDSDYVTNDKYVNGDYKEYEEDVYEQFVKERIKY